MISITSARLALHKPETGADTTAAAVYTWPRPLTAKPHPLTAKPHPLTAKPHPHVTYYPAPLLTLQFHESLRVKYTGATVRHMVWCVRREAWSGVTRGVVWCDERRGQIYLLLLRNHVEIMNLV